MTEVIEHRSMGKRGFATARDTIEFIESGLRFTDGKPFVLFPWQKKWLMRVLREHEWVITNTKTGEVRVEVRRIVSNSLMTIPRKNGKTGLFAALVCAFMLGPLWVRGIEIVCAATKFDQAKILFDEVKKIMLASPVFAMDGTFTYHAKSIFSEQHGSTFFPVSSAEAGNHGLNCHVVLLDELARMPNSNIFHTLNEAVSTKPNSFVGAISTMDNRIDNPMTELIRGHEARLAAGIKSDNWDVLEHKANLDPEKGGDPDPLSQANIEAANPSYHYLPELRNKIENARLEAMSDDGAKERFKIVRLNVAGASETQLVDPTKWRDLAHPDGRAHTDTFDKGEEVHLGIDLSRSRDLTAVGMWWPERRFLDCMCFLPTKYLSEYQTRHRLPFAEWVEAGHVVAATGRVVNYKTVARYIGELEERYTVTMVRRDRWKGELLDEALEQAGVSVQCEDIAFGPYTMNNYLIHIENLVEDGEFTHSNSPILNYCIHSTATVSPPQAMDPVRKPVKAYHNSLIDGAIAAMLALGNGAEADTYTEDDIMLTLDD